jgi:hypothetical protein
VLEKGKHDTALWLIEHGAPFGHACLSTVALHTSDLNVFRSFYTKGLRWGKYSSSAIVRCPSLEIVKTAYQEFGCPYDGGHFAKAIEYAHKDVLEWLYDAIQDGGAISIPQQPATLDVIGAFTMNVHKVDNDPRYGFNCYGNIARRGDFARFKWLTKRIPFLESESEFWQIMMRPEEFFWFDEKLRQNGLVEERKKMLEWCLENKFGFTTSAVRSALGAGQISTAMQMLDAGVAVTDQVIAGAIWNGDFDLVKQLYERGGSSVELLPSTIWRQVAGEAPLPILEWLLERGCPINDKTIVSIIDDAPKERLQWLLDHGFPLDERCWAVLSNRYRLDDTDEMLEWLKENNCPLDHNVCDHMDINRPYAGKILYFVDKLIKQTNNS